MPCLQAENWCLERVYHYHATTETMHKLRVMKVDSISRKIRFYTRKHKGNSKQLQLNKIRKPTSQLSFGFATRPPVVFPSPVHRAFSVSSHRVSRAKGSPYPAKFRARVRIRPAIRSMFGRIASPNAPPAVVDGEIDSLNC